MKIINVIKNYQNLKAVIEKDIAGLPFSVSRAMVKNYKTLLAEVEIFEEERNKLAVGFVDKTDEEKLAINEKIKEMSQTDVDIEIIKVVLTENIELTAKDMICLDFMLEEDN